MQDFALMLDECASAAADVLVIQAVRDRIGEFVGIDGFAGDFRRVNRSGNDGYAKRFKVGKPGLVVSQLLTAEPSPVAAVQQHHAPAAGSHRRQALNTAADRLQFQIGETVSRVQFVAQTLCHL